ncbi:MAG TPA: dCTP deaminase [Cytophagales bacterium]|nr:dCTP deaminase [Cytophagales bacterium]HRG08323.1 dCTP deaminase [Cyclobacteriaceae bacterium]
MYLLKNDIKRLLDKSIFIRPLLEESQIGELTVDFRLGYDFLVSIQGREPFIDASHNHKETFRNTGNFFVKTRRRPGEDFLLHPGQTILGTSLEYIKLPGNVFIILNMRSSYSRLGLSISTIVQPGYCGCISIELTNANKNPINLTVGSRLFQARFLKISKSTNYFSTERKYICSVRPQLATISEDGDLKTLKNYYNENN